MNIEINKKENEKKWAELFISAFNESSWRGNILLPDEEIKPIEQNESPDFILSTTKNRKIGVELTSLMNQETKKIEACRSKLLEKLKERHLQIELPPASVHIEFKLEAKINCDKNTIVSLSNLVKEMLAKKETEKYSYQLPEKLHTFIYMIYIAPCKFTEYKDKTGYRTTYQFEEKIQFVINEKNKCLPKYRKEKLDEYWLVIQIDNICQSGGYDMDMNIINEYQPFNTEFEQIFLLPLTFGCLYPLKTTR